MINKFTLICLCFFSTFAYSQQKLNDGYLITLTNDTVFGAIKKVNFYKAQRIQINTKTGNNIYKIKSLKELYYNNERYSRLLIKQDAPKDTLYLGLFYKPIITSGNILATQNNKYINLKRNKAYFNKSMLKYYADDFEETATFIKQKNNKDSLIEFIKKYNIHRLNNPESQSFAEKNLHYKKTFNPQVALHFTGFLPSYLFLGTELGFTKNLTVTPKVSFLLAKEFKDSKLRPIPFIEFTGKYYITTNKRIRKEKTTFLYSGTYLSTTYMQPIGPNITRAIRYEIGSKFVAFSKLYADYNIGIIKGLDNNETALWITWGWGYNF